MADVLESAPACASQAEAVHLETLRHFRQLSPKLGRLALFRSGRANYVLASCYSMGLGMRLACDCAFNAGSKLHLERLRGLLERIKTYCNSSEVWSLTLIYTVAGGFEQQRI